MGPNGGLALEVTLIGLSVCPTFPWLLKNHFYVPDLAGHDRLFRAFLVPYSRR